MIKSLERLGIHIESDDEWQSLRVHGSGGIIPAAEADLYIANSGTSVRFLTGLVALGHGRYRLDGTPRMRERPIQDLLEALAQLGVEAKSEAGTGCPPVVVESRGLRGGRTSVRGDVSSQFLSGLLLTAPYAEQAVELDVEGELVSKPYIRITLAVMDAFGVHVDAGDYTRFRVPRQPYKSREYAIEPDASAASYFFAAAAITGGEVSVEGLSQHSLQGDVQFCECLERMGCAVRYGADRTTVIGQPLRGITVDMNAISDTVQTLSAVAVFADGPTTITGVGHIRHKETDRIGNLAIELRKLGRTLRSCPTVFRSRLAHCMGPRSRPTTTIAWR